MSAASEPAQNRAQGVGARLQIAWREIMDAEQARGAAQAAAQAAYEEALSRFRHMQMELFTVTLGSLDLLVEQMGDLTPHLGARIDKLRARVDALEVRIDHLERAVGASPAEHPDPLNPY